MIIYDDIRNLTASRLRDDLGFLPSCIVGSPPCQDASFAACGSERRGIDGERTGLFWEYLRLVRELRPVWLCAENVVGIESVGFDRITCAMEEAGYHVRTFDLGAEDFGGPHKRRRLWWIALSNTNKKRFPIGTSLQSATGSPGIGTIIGSAEAARNPWREGESRALRMADGISCGVVNTAAAFGDAVIPQITEAIGRAMMKILPTDGTVLDLFAGGAGGWSLGMHRAGYRTVAMCEIDPWRRQALRANFAGISNG